ncbi:MAG TPA: hypothetical protein VMA13_09370 [Candidatus Saccharimonadales bacterium]|nr:hypothetical protein [Candidatus Saccharimonadales bacterium]
MSGSREHELIVAMVARYIRQQGYELVAFECSLSWLFGKSFRLPPSITLHRPDILGVRKESPLICIGEGKTRNDLRSMRTRQQLKDFTDASVEGKSGGCEVVVGIPDDCKPRLEKLCKSLDLPLERIKIITVPTALLNNHERR